MYFNFLEFLTVRHMRDLASMYLSLHSPTYLKTNTVKLTDFSKTSDIKQKHLLTR